MIRCSGIGLAQTLFSRRSRNLRRFRAGKYRNGLGIDWFFHALEDCYVTTIVDRRKTPPWGLEGGYGGRTNDVGFRRPDGSREVIPRATGVKIPKGSTLELACAGGGGYGPPDEREPGAVRKDVLEGYITEAHARAYYPHALKPDAPLGSSGE